MRTSYKKDDVELLLKDITGLVKPLSTEEREKEIQSGRHYSEMLPLEYVPTDEYMKVYKEALNIFAKDTALAVGNLSDKIIRDKGKNIVIVSLARAGIPIGILVKRFIKKKYRIDLPHYSISIIRGKGIDNNAMKYLLDRYLPEQILFLDGWIGKGAILRELQSQISNYEGVSSDIAVISDPANVTKLYGTREDILIPSSCLNSTVSGLVSRTFFRDDIIGENDFHGAAYYEELKDRDLSYEFIEAIESEFQYDRDIIEENKEGSGIEEVLNISKAFEIEDINLIKPGIGETTRVLLRRIPWKILINKKYKDDLSIKPIIRLATERNVDIVFYDLKNYKCCGIIKKLADA